MSAGRPIEHAEIAVRIEAAHPCREAFHPRESQRDRRLDAGLAAVGDGDVDPGAHQGATHVQRRGRSENGQRQQRRDGQRACEVAAGDSKGIHVRCLQKLRHLPMTVACMATNAAA